MNKKEKGEPIFGRVKRPLLSLLIFSLFFFILSLSGFVTAENTGNSENSNRGIFFDIKIIDFESPMELGEFFEFTYLIKGISDTDKDIEIYFSIEKQGEVVTSGSDTIYIGDSEEKIETTKIFLPKNVESGVYDFVVEVIYDSYRAKSHRTIEIEIKQGIARITTAKGKVLNTYLVAALVGLAIFILSLIFYLERRKIKKQFRQGEKWIKKYKIFVLALCLFIILGILVYYLDFVNGVIRKISKAIFGLRITVLPYLVTPSFYYVLGAVLIFVVFLILKNLIKKKQLFKKLGHWLKERKPKKKAKVKEKKKPKKLIKIKKKKIKIKRIFGKYHPFKQIKRFFGKILNSLKKIKIKFPKKPKKKEKLVKIQKVPAKQKKLKVSHKLKFKKISIRVRRVVNRLGITTRKLLRFFKKKAKSTPKVLPKKQKKFKKKKKKSLKKARKRVKKIYKNVFKYLNKIFGKKTYGRILQEFENTFVKTGKFTQRHFKTLKDIIDVKTELEKKEWEQEFKEHKEDFHKTLDELKKNAKNLIRDLIKYSKKHKKVILREENEKVRKTRTWVNKLGKFFKKKPKSSKVFVLKKSKQVRQISKQEKKIAKEKRKELKQRYKNIFRLLKRIFGRKSKKRMIRDFEKAVTNTKKFSGQSLATLKEFARPKKRIKKRKLNFHKLEEAAKNTENLVSELTTNFGNLLSLKKNKKRLRNKFKHFFLKITPKKLFKKRRKLEENRKSMKEFFNKKLKQDLKFIPKSDTNDV